jgi:hypothetical protein
MSREEDLIRSTTHAIASTVREVPPLRLEPAPNKLRSPSRGPRRLHGGSGRQRRWRSWAAPLTAAAMVVALAVSLVLVRDIPNDGAVSPNPTSSAGPGGVPRYYVALTQFGGDTNGIIQLNDIVVGDSLTGKTLATFAPPAGTTFESVTAAADDRTFVVFAVTSSTGSFDLSSKATLTGSWYAVRLFPGTAHPARLTHLPIKPLTVANSDVNIGIGGLLYAYGTVLSGSGRELAVPESIGSRGLAVKVFSVATGQLLHEWTTNDRSVVQEPSLAWIDGDRKLALVSRSTDVQPNAKFVTENVTMREWPVAGPASGDLVAVSKLVWHVQIGTGKGPLTLTTVQLCVEPVVGGPVLISGDGKTFSCTTAGGWGPTDHLSFHTYPLTASTTATAQGTIDYQVTYTNKGRYIPEVVWTNPSGDTLIGALLPIVGGSPVAVYGPRIGVISHGKFTSLRLPASLAAATVTDIAF